MPYEHLRFERETPVNQRRPRGAPRVSVPESIPDHGRALLRSLNAVRASRPEEPGFDNRQLLKIRTQAGVDPGVFERIPGVEVVSQEGDNVVLAFATPEALATFETRLTRLSNGDLPTRKEILFALEAFDVWTPADRTGWALRTQGAPAGESFLLDVELWPLTLAHERQQLTTSFEQFCRQRNLGIVDSVRQSSLLLFRVRTTAADLEAFLNHRDVRTVDLPPAYALEQQLLDLDIQGLDDVPPPPADAPGIVVLDSGLATGQPLLAPAVGEAAGFIAPERRATDDHGHGTLVSGIALYGDIEEQAMARRFVPLLRLFSARVLDANAEANRRFIENQVEEAVRYFLDTYGCRIFNFSYGDRNRPLSAAGRAGRMAYTLDRLSRELGVLFIVPTGNFDGIDERRIEWRGEYPDYLAINESGLIDPAPAVNAITVGSLARWDADFVSQRFAPGADTLPVARRDCPSPFTRHGPGINNSIKPEVVAYGGNWAVMTRAGNRVVTQGLGEISASKDFVGGRLFSEQYGTSFAAPHIANAAANVLRFLPRATPELIRALLVNSAKVPAAAQTLFNGDAAEIRKVCGYGQLDFDALLQSTDNSVTLYAETAIADKRNHIYEIPIPEDFLMAGLRDREVSISLAYSPAVSTTRLDYVATKLTYRFVRASTLEEVSRAYSAQTPNDQHEPMPELTNNRTVTAQERSRGAVQSSQWTFRTASAQLRDQKLYVVVTRSDAIWGGILASAEERYALVITLRDRGHIAPTLYAQVRAQLDARVRQRVQL
jgi:hypothetical protein